MLEAAPAAERGDDMTENLNEEDRHLREIPTWTRRYAQSRTLPVLVILVIFVLGSSAFAGFSLLTAWAYVTGRRFLAAFSAA